MMAPHNRGLYMLLVSHIYMINIVSNCHNIRLKWKNAIFQLINEYANMILALPPGAPFTNKDQFISQHG